MSRPPRTPSAATGRPSRWVALALFAGLSLGVAQPSWAFLGLLSKVGKLAKVGKAASVGKGGAAAGAAVVGADAVEGAAAANRVLPTSAEALSRASGLGKAVPDEVAAMLKTPGKTLSDIPDPMVNRWLSASPHTQTLADANGMMIDVQRLSSGKTAIGKPVQTHPTAAETQPVAGRALPWYAIELTLRAAHLGHRAAMLQRASICRDPAQPSSLRTSAECHFAVAGNGPAGG
jgi:hypothetical protein